MALWKSLRRATGILGWVLVVLGLARLLIDWVIQTDYVRTKLFEWFPPVPKGTTAFFPTGWMLIVDMIDTDQSMVGENLIAPALAIGMVAVGLTLIARASRR